MTILGTVALYATIPVVAAFAGGLIAAIRLPSATVRSALQHFAAGVVFAAAALELLPKVSHETVFVPIAGFTVGIVLMYLLRRWSDRAEMRGSERSATGLVAASGADTLIDGVILGASFAGGSGRQGLLIGIALTLEIFFLGLSVAASLTAAPKWRIVTTSLGLGVALFIGAIVGALVFQGASAAILGGVFAFGAVVFMYLVTEELLTEAHEGEQRAWMPALFFVGFLVYLVVEELF